MGKVKIPIQNYWLIGLLVLAAVFYLLNWNNLQVGQNNDDAHYVVTAWSLVNGQGFSLTNYAHIQPETKYPPLFPLLLALLAWFFPGNVDILKVIPFCFTLLDVLLLNLFLEKIEVKPLLRQGIVVLFALHPITVSQAAMIMSEPVYLAVLLMALLYLKRPPLKVRRSETVFGFLAGLLGAVGFLVRIMGLTLLPAAGLALLTRKLWWRATAFGLVFLLVVSIWGYRNLTIGNSGLFGGYEDDVKQAQLQSNLPEEKGFLPALKVLARRLPQNTWEEVSAYLPALLVPALPGPGTSVLVVSADLPFWEVVIGLGITGLLGLGAFIYARSKGLDTPLWFTASQLGLLLIWTFTFQRYYYAVLPFCYLYFLTAIDFLLGKVRVLPHIQAVRPFLTRLKLSENRFLLTLILLMVLNLYITIYNTINPMKDQMRDFQAGVDWLNQNTPSDAILMTNFAPSVWLYARRPTADYPAWTTSESIQRDIKEKKADFIILGPDLDHKSPVTTPSYVQRYLRPFIEQNPGDFLLVYRDLSKALVIYQVIHSN